MSWAARRRFLIVFGIFAIVVAFLAVFAIASLYKTPSCSDGIQNQGEQGVDCGGPCPYLCTDQQQAPVVLFTKAFVKGNGYTDAVASIENRNATAAAKDVSYTLTLYGKDQVIVQRVTGTVDLPPATTMPVYVTDMPTGQQTAVHAFLTIASTSPQWYRMQRDTRVLPTVSNTAVGGATSTPRVSATLSNTTNTPMSDVPVIVIVHDAQNDVIAASKTLVASIPAQGQATATFTWNVPFSGIPADIEVVPVVPLP